MREMHKWKDKVELSLDNRQIFFLFFGLSVVGCFIFALGIMTGRRLEWEPSQQVASLGGQSLSMLEEELESFEFKKGIAESSAADVPPTRDPDVPPRDEKEVKEEKEALAAAAKEQAKEQAKADAEDRKQVEAVKAEAEAKAAEAKKKAAEAEKKGEANRLFTLQMKAFSRGEDAEMLADKLRRNGHDIRVEKAIVRGREWHRVRLGVFEDWENAVTAKGEFEKSEHLIAYVVSM